MKGTRFVQPEERRDEVVGRVGHDLLGRALLRDAAACRDDDDLVAEAITLGDKIVIVATGGRIAQQGTPEEIMADPADDFVTSFLGLDEARALHVSGRLVVDPTGRPVGRLA